MATFNSAPHDVAAWTEALSGFASPIVSRLLKIIRRTAPHLEESIRWNMPSWKGRSIVCGVGAFKKHVSLTFWRGAELPDPHGLLVNGAGGSAMRSAKFTSPSEVQEKVVAAWVAAAVDLDNEGPPPRPKREPKPEPVIPAALAKALAKNAAARAAYHDMRPSCRHEYCRWIAEAKQEATIARRVTRVLEKLQAGEGLMDQYKR